MFFFQKLQIQLDNSYRNSLFHFTWNRDLQCPIRETISQEHTLYESANFLACILSVYINSSHICIKDYLISYPVPFKKWQHV